MAKPPRRATKAAAKKSRALIDAERDDRLMRRLLALQQRIAATARALVRSVHAADAALADLGVAVAVRHGYRLVEAREHDDLVAETAALRSRVSEMIREHAAKGLTLEPTGSAR